MAQTKDPKDFLPLSPPVYQILLTLGDRTMHGYGIIQEFEKRSGDAGALLPGSLYNTVSRMLKAELIVECDTSENGEKERRRYYRVTEQGRQVAIAETRRLSLLLRMAREADYAEDPDALLEQ